MEIDNSPPKTPKNVVQLRPDRFPVRRVSSNKRPTCMHRRTLIDASKRVFECEDCGIDMDPYQWIARLAGDADWTIHMRAEKKRLDAEIDKLKKDVTRVRAARKRAHEATFGAAVKACLEALRQGTARHQAGCVCHGCEALRGLDATLDRSATS